MMLMFRIFDANRDGFVSKTEAKKIFKVAINMAQFVMVAMMQDMSPTLQAAPRARRASFALPPLPPQRVELPPPLQCALANPLSPEEIMRLPVEDLVKNLTSGRETLLSPLSAGFRTLDAEVASITQAPRRMSLVSGMSHGSGRSGSTLGEYYRSIDVSRGIR
eukprot:EC795758.1.p1 GENE.EC795758.1~~EC795758.1.p1  ORF type:complete len:163 (+),score=51.33 EC795758.1:129-617(+)